MFDTLVYASLLWAGIVLGGLLGLGALVGFTISLLIPRKTYFDYEGTPSPITETASHQGSGFLFPEGTPSGCKNAILDG